MHEDLANALLAADRTLADALDGLATIPQVIDRLRAAGSQFGRFAALGYRDESEKDWGEWSHRSARSIRAAWRDGHATPMLRQVWRELQEVVGPIRAELELVG